MGALAKKYSPWWDQSSPDFAFQPQLPICADVVIIGAGFAGISTAYWLLRLIKKAKRKGLRIVVIDEAPYAAFRSSGRMNGSVYLGSHLPASKVVDLLGDSAAQNLYSYSALNNKELEELAPRLQCDAEFNGGCRLASTAKEAVALNKSDEVLREWGYSPVRFDQRETQHMMVAPKAIGGSLFVPGEGMFDPFAFTNKLARLLRKNNVWIVYGARVTETGASDEAAYVELSNGHIIATNKVVHTHYSTVPWDGILDSVEHKREHVIQTESLTGDPNDTPVPFMPVECNEGDSFRIYNHCAMMTGGKTRLKKDPELGNINDSSYNDKILLHLEETMHKNFPITFHADVGYAWTYIETQSIDSLPLMGQVPGYKGHYMNIAHGRNKLGLAFLGAKNVAEKILRARSSVNEFKIFDPKRFA